VTVIEASSSPFSAPRRWDSRAKLVAGTLILAVFAFAAVALVLRRGTPFNPDGWFYWQGSPSPS
jgi:hypothetical protein